MATFSASDPMTPFTPLTSEEELRLWPLAVHARHLLRQLHFVDYGQAEQDASILAQKLLNIYPLSELRHAAFVGLPRGGLIVLGLLAYHLDLEPEQFLPTFLPDADLVILVDDCALSGLRLQQTISKLNSERIVIAHLYSTPGLRSAVQARFPNVETCLAAHDLREKPLPADPSTADDRLDTFLDGRLYRGPDEIVAFAWNEPDLLVLTPFDNHPAHQWRFLPPHKCLKNRQALGLPPGPHVIPTWVVPEGIVYGWFDGILYLLDTQRAVVYRLDGLAADCWRSAAGYGTTETALAFLRHRHTGADAIHLTQQLEEILPLFEAQRFRLLKKLF